ncbi:MAG: DUF4124 domain-containing protein [Dokdonella sp.]
MKISACLMVSLIVTCAGAVWNPPLAVAAGAYSWVDSNGVTHYSDQPPPATAKEARRLKLSSGYSNGTVASPVEAESTEGKKMALAAGYREEDIERNCEIATKNLSALDAAPPLTAGSEQATAREENKQQAQGQVKLFCN